MVNLIGSNGKSQQLTMLHRKVSSGHCNAGLCRELQEIVDICTSGFEHALFPFERTPAFIAARERRLSELEVPRAARVGEAAEVRFVPQSAERRTTLEPSGMAMEMDYGDMSAALPSFEADR